MKDRDSLSYKDNKQRVPQKAYNINHNYFLHIDQSVPVPFNLEEAFSYQRSAMMAFTSSLSEKKKILCLDCSLKLLTLYLSV